MPDFIQRAVGAEKLKVGLYQPAGTPVDKDGISEPLVNIRPLKPFGIDPKTFGKFMFVYFGPILLKRCALAMSLRIFVQVDSSKSFEVLKPHSCNY